MRVAIVAETFLPATNGVTNSVIKILQSLRRLGHEAMVIAPGTSKLSATRVPMRFDGFPVHTVVSVPVRQFRVGLPSTEIELRLRAFRPDVVHVAAPFILGMRGMIAARAMGLPTVAVYQTDMPSYIRQHAGPAGLIAEEATWRWVRRIHAMANLTLAPSTATVADLVAHDIPRVALWGRGVDAELYHPRWKDDPRTLDLRTSLIERGETLVGYVGRLAPEKELYRLAELERMPGVRLAVIGDGPSRASDEAALPEATFLGFREGEALARAYAALDVFVHTGTKETFGQTLQEAAASELPVVAPARGGPLDIVESGVTGHLFDPDQPGSLRAAVADLVGPDQAARRLAMGALGRERVASRSWDALVEQLVEHYERVLAAAVRA